MRFFSIVLMAVSLAAPVYAHAQATEPDQDLDQPGATAAQDAAEIVVTGVRPEGSIPGEATPVESFSAAEVRAFGAASVAEALAAIAPQTGTARGRGAGAPVVLLNGRRISNFRDIRDLPSEAIQRIEVFTEEVALQFGFSADQRVVNIVLRPRYRAVTTELGLGGAADGARDTVDGEAGFLRLTRQDRLAFNVNAETASAITEAERGISPPESGLDDRAATTVAPDQHTIEASASLNRTLTPVISATASISLDVTEQDRQAGLTAASGAPRPGRRDQETARADLTLDRAGEDFSWTATAALQRDEAETFATRGSGDGELTRRVETRAAAGFGANAAVFALPAGRARFSLRADVSDAALISETFAATGAGAASLDRTEKAARLTLTAPLASRRRDVLAGLGDLSLNASVSAAALSDFETLEGQTAGLTWRPSPDVRIAVQATREEAAPSLQQLGDPITQTEDVSVFDPIRGETVSATVIAGGNPALAVERREDLTVNANWSPAAVEGLSLSASYVINRSDNAVLAFPTPTAALEAAFPERFTRDAAGVLTALDRRPINVAERRTETLRMGFSFSRGFGPQAQPPWGSGPPPEGLRQRVRAEAPAPAQPGGQTAQAPRPADQPPAQSQMRPPPGFFPPTSAEREAAQAGGRTGGGGRRGGFGFGGARAQVGRFDLAASYTARLQDEARLAAGGPPLDLLQAAALGRADETAGDQLELQGGVSWRGAGLRLSGLWREGYVLPGATALQDVTFSDVATVNLRGFVGFDARPDLVRRHPILRGVRFALRIENLTDAAPEARDGAGLTPFEFQEGLLSPTGRSFEVSLRKQF